MANPSDAPDIPPLRLYREFENIDDRIYMSRYGKEFIIHPRFSASLTRLHDYLLRFKPHIVHFAGHGSSQGQLVFEDQNGRSQIADQNVIEGIFDILKGNIRLVFLNACYSVNQANLISRFVPVVIGMTGGILDIVATEFAGGFYGGIANGLSVSQAHGLGLHMLRLFNPPVGDDIPDLEQQIGTIQMINNGVSDPSGMRFTKREYRVQ